MASHEKKCLLFTAGTERLLMVSKPVGCHSKLHCDPQKTHTPWPPAAVSVIVHMSPQQLH